MIFEQRKDLMRDEDVHETIEDIRLDLIDDLVAACIPKNAYAEQREVKSLHEEVLRLFALDLPIPDAGELDEDLQKYFAICQEKPMSNTRLSESVAFCATSRCMQTCYRSTKG